MGTKNNKNNKQHHQHQQHATISTNFNTPTATVTGRQFIQNHGNTSNNKSNKKSSSTPSPISQDSAIIQCSRSLISTPNDNIKTDENIQNQEDFDTDQADKQSKPVLVSTTADFLPQNLLTALQIQSLNYNITSWNQESKICPTTGETIIETKLISRPMHPYLEKPRFWTREIILGSGSHFRAPYREAIYQNFENDKYEVVKATEKQTLPPPLPPPTHPSRYRPNTVTKNKNARKNIVENQQLPETTNYHEMNNNRKKSAKLCKKLLLPENSSSPENHSNSISMISSPDINNNIFLKPDFMLSEPENEENNNNSKNLFDLFKPDFLKPDFDPFSNKNDRKEHGDHEFYKIPRSATMTCNNTSISNNNGNNNFKHRDPEMSSFVQNHHNIRFNSHGHMNNIKDIRNRAKAIKRQEEKERKRKEREHLNSANELSKSCIEHLNLNIC